MPSVRAVHDAFAEIISGQEELLRRLNAEAQGLRAQEAKARLPAVLAAGVAFDRAASQGDDGLGALPVVPGCAPLQHMQQLRADAAREAARLHDLSSKAQANAFQHRGEAEVARERAAWYQDAARDTEAQLFAPGTAVYHFIETVRSNPRGFSTEAFQAAERGDPESMSSYFLGRGRIAARPGIFAWAFDPETRAVRAALAAHKTATGQDLITGLERRAGQLSNAARKSEEARQEETRAQTITDLKDQLKASIEDLPRNADHLPKVRRAYAEGGSTQVGGEALMAYMGQAYPAEAAAAIGRAERLAAAARSAEPLSKAVKEFKSKLEAPMTKLRRGKREAPSHTIRVDVEKIRADASKLAQGAQGLAAALASLRKADAAIPNFDDWDTEVNSGRKMAAADQSDPSLQMVLWTIIYLNLIASQDATACAMAKQGFEVPQSLLPPVDLPGSTPDGLSPDAPQLHGAIPGLHSGDGAMGVDLTTAMAGVPNVTVDVPSISIEVPDIKVDVPSITFDVPNISVDVPSISVDVPSISIDTSSTSSF